VNLEKLVAASRSREEVRAYKAFAPTEEEKQLLAEVGREVLQNLPPQAGACALMSAIYAARLQDVGLNFVYVVAGTLRVLKRPVFGSDRPFDGSKVFSESNSDWDGHAWVMFGPYVADISIFRTARSSCSPPLLATHVRQEFGDGRGLLIVRWTDAPKSGLEYSPQYVLSDAQVTALVAGARAHFTGQI
jgi:hypothetical protein